MRIAWVCSFTRVIDLVNEFIAQDSGDRDASALHIQQVFYYYSLATRTAKETIRENIIFHQKGFGNFYSPQSSGSNDTDQHQPAEPTNQPPSNRSNIISKHSARPSLGCNHNLPRLCRFPRLVSMRSACWGGQWTR